MLENALKEKLTPLEQQLKALEEEKRQAENQKRQAEIFRKLQEKYADDYNEDELKSTMSKLPEMSEEDLVDLVFRSILATKREGTIAQRIQRKTAEAGSAFTPPVRPGSPSEKAPKSFAEARNLLLG
jgi:predicted metal-dependent hydrolase